MGRRRHRPAADVLRPRFWERVALADMTLAEWEALCDGCGRCCLLKLEDADTAEVAFTHVGCRLLDSDTCRCGNYAIRKQLVPDCVVLTPQNIAEIAYWMPETCAYRILWQGEELPRWHPLVSGDPESVRRAGISMAGRVVPEWEVAEEDLEDHLLEES